MTNDGKHKSFLDKVTDPQTPADVHADLTAEAAAASDRTAVIMDRIRDNVWARATGSNVTRTVGAPSERVPQPALVETPVFEIRRTSAEDAAAEDATMAKLRNDLTAPRPKFLVPGFGVAALNALGETAVGRVIGSVFKASGPRNG